MTDKTTEDIADRLRSLADLDARSGEPLGKCMREAADVLVAERAERAALKSLLLAEIDLLRAKVVMAMDYEGSE